MDKRYIKLNGELVEIVGMDVANSKFAPVDSPIFTGSGLIEFTDGADDDSIVNVGYLKEELANVNSRFEEVTGTTEAFVTTLENISEISSVKVNDTISLDPSSLDSYPELTDNQGRVDNSKAGIVAIEGVKLLISSMTGSGGIQESITNMNNTLTNLNNTVQEMKTQLEADLTEIRKSIELLNTKLTTLELNSNGTTGS